MADGNLYYARNVEFTAIGWRNFMGAVGSALHLDRHRSKMASACIEDPRFVSTHIDIHSDAIGQIVPALKEILLIVVPSRFLRTFRQPHRPAIRYGYSSSSVTSR